MGMLASEIRKRWQRDLDDDCGSLWVDSGKMPSARRHLRIPEFLRPHLRKLLGGAADALLLPRYDGEPDRRQALWTAVQRACKQAAVAQAYVHSLRGMYATLAVESGAISETVAKSLGHSSFNMTERHYAQPSAVSNSRSARVEGVLGVG